MDIRVKKNRKELSMKKTYINPDLKVVVLHTSCHILAGSELGYQGNYDSSTVSIGARGDGSYWDEDED